MAKAYKDVCPCKDCNKRTENCHGTCKEYKEWKESGIEIENKVKCKNTNYAYRYKKR